MSDYTSNAENNDYLNALANDKNKGGASPLKDFYFGRLNNKLETSQDGEIKEWTAYENKVDLFLETKCIRDKKYYSVNFGEAVNFTVYLKDLTSDFFWKNTQQTSSTVS